MSSAGQIVTQLIVDSHGATLGAAEYEAAFDKIKAANAEGVGALTSYESAQRKWQNSLATTDPIIRANLNLQKQMERQMLINVDALRLLTHRHKIKLQRKWSA